MIFTFFYWLLGAIGGYETIFNVFSHRYELSEETPQIIKKTSHLRLRKLQIIDQLFTFLCEAIKKNRYVQLVLIFYFN
jgi:hypothetical protein